MAGEVLADDDQTRLIVHGVLQRLADGVAVAEGKHHCPSSDESSAVLSLNW
jgi:hypothetical protein